MPEPKEPHECEKMPHNIEVTYDRANSFWGVNEAHLDSGEHFLWSINNCPWCGEELK